MTIEPVDLEPQAPLDARATAMLAAYRDNHAMPAHSRERVWAKLAGGIGPGDDGGPSLDSTPDVWTHASRATRPFARPSVVAGVGVLVAAGVALVLLGRPSPERSPESAPAGSTSPSTSVDASHRPQPVPASPSPVIASPSRVESQALVGPSPLPEPPSSTSAIGTKRSDRTRTRSRTRSSSEPLVSTPSDPPISTSELARERALIEQAHAALAKGRADLALESLDEHAESFSNGVFAEEREALQAIAACKGGQLELGRTRARAFVDAHPRAVLGPRVRGSCGLDEHESSIEGGDVP